MYITYDAFRARRSTQRLLVLKNLYLKDPNRYISKESKLSFLLGGVLELLRQGELQNALNFKTHIR